MHKSKKSITFAKTLRDMKGIEQSVKKSFMEILFDCVNLVSGLSWEDTLKYGIQALNLCREMRKAQ